MIPIIIGDIPIIYGDPLSGLLTTLGFFFAVIAGRQLGLKRMRTQNSKTKPKTKPINDTLVMPNTARTRNFCGF